MTDNLANASVFLVQITFGIYFFLLLLRLLMQAAGADFYNPICQAIVKITNPAVLPLKSLLPTLMKIDLATLTAALAVQMLAIFLMLALSGQLLFHVLFIAWAGVGVLSTILDIYFYALIVQVVASWIAPYSTHPALALVYQITEPVCAPARKLLPSMGGLDFSIILVFMGIVMVDRYLVVQPLAQMLGAPRGLVFGL